MNTAGKSTPHPSGRLRKAVLPFISHNAEAIIGEQKVHPTGKNSPSALAAAAVSKRQLPLINGYRQASPPA